MQLAFDLPDIPAPSARRSDPVTSHMAAEHAKQMALDHHVLILRVLRQHGPMGKDGIASRLRGLDGVAVCRRLVELQRKGEIVLTGRHVVSTAGRAEREWRAVS